MIEEANRYLIFEVGGEAYGTPLLEVREVVEYQIPKFMPNMAQCFAGVINIRGAIIGVVDLRVKFNFALDRTKKAAMLVCDTDQGPIAAVVDRVDSVAALEESQIEKKPPIQSVVDQDYLIGIAKYRDRLITMIDLLKTLSEEKFTKAG